MREELTAKLRESYPGMFPDNGGSPASISCGDGWFDLINLLCWEIQQEVNQTHEPAHPVTVRVIKQKMGAMRIQYSGGNPFVGGLVRMSQVMSYLICEECGNRGEHMTDTNWVEMVRCDIHAPKKRISPEELKRRYGRSE
jgi:hypothetical protein